MKFILTADLHFQYNTPICRTDNFIETQINKMKWLGELAAKNSATILSAGDVTHKAREDKQNEFLNMLLEFLPPMVGIFGNHDVLYHKKENIYKSTLGILTSTGKYKLLNGTTTLNGHNLHPFNWGEELVDCVKSSGKDIAIWHKMVLAPNDDLAQFVNGVDSETLLDKYPNYDVILTGDNHKTFVIEKDGRYLVNPGSFMRITAKQKDFEPSVFIYDTKTGSLEQVKVPIDSNAVSVEHLSAKTDMVDFNAYIEQIKNKEELSINFYENVMLKLKQEKISSLVEEKILSFLEA